MRTPLAIGALLALVIVPAHQAFAQTEEPIHKAIAEAFRTFPPAAFDAQSPAPRPVAIEYSDAYKTRAKIHKVASFATLPLFATELALGQSLYNNYPASRHTGQTTAHVVIGTSIIGLYGVQAVTGVMNLMESSKDPNQRKLRLTHSILMLASGAGFAITPLTAPGGGFRSAPGDPQLHRAMAITSIGIGTAGYLLMLFGSR
jgi:hypothetical protein